MPCIHLVPTVVVGIADYESRKDKEEVHCNVPVVQGTYDSVSCAVCHFGKREPLEDVVEKYQYGGYTAQPVKQFVVRLCIGEICR